MSSKFNHRIPRLLRRCSSFFGDKNIQDKIIRYTARIIPVQHGSISKKDKHSPEIIKYFFGINYVNN